MRRAARFVEAEAGERGLVAGELDAGPELDMALASRRASASAASIRRRPMPLP